MRPKVHVPLCRFCQKQFQRNEHLQRHERTHTREKPFACHCGRSFSRRDLLSRHDRLTHSTVVDAARDGGEARSVTETTAPLDAEVPSSPAMDETMQDPIENPDPAPAHDSHLPCDGDSTRARHRPGPGLADGVNDANANPAAMILPPQVLPPVDHYQSLPTTPVTREYSVHPAWDTSFAADLDMWWTNLETNAGALMPASFTSLYPMNILASTQNTFPDMGSWDVYNSNNHDNTTTSRNAHQMGLRPGNHRANSREKHSGIHGTFYGNGTAQPATGVLSRYESRLPSMQPDEESQELAEPRIANKETPLQTAQSPFQEAGIPWRISKEGYQLIVTVMQQHESVLPQGFHFPTRHSFCRFVEGFFSGFQEHLPCLHIPTISLVTAAPELILALAAVGARYRFQRGEAHQLYLAAKSLLEHQLSLREAEDQLFIAPMQSPAGDNFPSLSPASIRDTGLSAEPREAPGPLYQDSMDKHERDQQTMQAMIFLIALGTWNSGSLLKDALSMGSRLAIMVREDSRRFPDSENPHLTWPDWVSAEGNRRTKMVAMSLLNLLSITYNIPPKIPHSEVGHLKMPAPETWWRAENDTAWNLARNRDVYREETLHTSYHHLLNVMGDTSHVPPSSFGNYILIHCIIQQIYFCTQFSAGFPTAGPLTLPQEIITQLGTSLRRWQQNWESTKDSSLEPMTPSGPLSFNSTGLMRLAYIRLSADMGPCRQLEFQDPRGIAHGFHNAPLLERSPYVQRAVIQCAHSLSIPVRIGIEFVARTQALTWSIVHSLCNLECGMFLAKWLETMAAVIRAGDAPREDESRLLALVAGIIGETELGPPVEQEVDLERRTRLMAIAVLRLWGHTFSGVHVYDIMGTIRGGLDLCAKMLQRDLDETQARVT